MSRRFGGLYRAMMFGLALGSLPLGEAGAAPEVVPGEYIVRFKSAGAPAAFSLSKRLAAQKLRAGRTVAGRVVVSSPAAVSLGAGSSQPRFAELDPADTTCKDLLAAGLAESCEPNYKLQAYAAPNDPSFTRLWGLSSENGIDAPHAWDLNQGSGDVVVAVIDTGVDYTHPDLAPNMWINAREIAGNGVDDDRNGYADDVHGINAMTRGGDPMDDNGHGTHVSGTIGAVGDNGVGIAGINWRVKIMGLKFLGADGSGSVSSVLDAIEYLLIMKRRGVNVRLANNSWGGAAFSQALREAIQTARDAGVLFIAAAGNEASDNDAFPSYPANYALSNVVSVAAVDQSGNLASFSNYGVSQVDIAAPGVAILSTVPGGYASYSGTSMATPHVTGALALLISSEPALSNEALLDRLYSSAVPYSSLSGLIRTGRALNAGRMLFNETAPVPPGSTAPSCSFAVQPETGAPDQRADSGTLAMENTDEGFVSVTLPFVFPFEGRPVSQITLSPNGVLYFGGAPALLDYQPGDQAPSNSLAALQSDLVSTVRLSLNGDSATFLWTSRPYSMPQSGEAHVRVTLNASGAIQEWIEITAPAVQALLQSQSTLGISGRTGSGVTFAHNSATLTSGLALSYAPVCQAQPPPVEVPVSISSVKLFGLQRLNRRAGLAEGIKAGGRFRVRITGNGQSARSALVTFSLDKNICPEARQVEVKPGRTHLDGRLPYNIEKRFRRLTVNVESLRSSRSIGPTQRRLRRKSVSSRRLSFICNRIVGSLRMDSRLR